MTAPPPPASITPTPVDRPLPSPSPEPSPSESAAPTEPAIDSVPIPADTYAIVVADDLRVRSKPGVSDDSKKLEPPLQPGDVVPSFFNPVIVAGSYFASFSGCLLTIELLHRRGTALGSWRSW